MRHTHLADPLQRFPVFSTSDSEEFRNALMTRFGAMRAELKRPAGFRARGNMVQLQSITLVYGGSSAGVLAEYPEADRFRLLTAQSCKGEAVIGRTAIGLDAGQSCMVSPGQRVTLASNARHTWFNLRIDPGAFQRKLACLLGAPPKGRLEFAPAVDRNSPRFQQLWRLIRFLSDQLDATSEPLSPLVLRELEQAVLVAFLSVNRHNFSHLLDGEARDTVPSHVRRAEGFIEAHWDQAIKIEDLVDATGVSARAIFKAFQQARGYSPMAFARTVRLKRARDMLSAPDAETSVTSVAFVCGFGNLGHFARDYRQAFGELPSATLAHAARRG
jgi:AraC-like DNA-binding protein